MSHTQRASGLRLKFVGKYETTKQSRFATKTTGNQTISDDSFESEIKLMPQKTGMMTESEGDELEQHPGGLYAVIEDPRLSRFSFSRLLVLQKNLLILTLLLLFLGMVKIESEHLFAKEEGVSKQITIVMSFTTIFIAILAILRKSVALQLEVDQKKRFQHPGQYGIWRQFLSWEVLLEMLVQLLIIAPHPNVFTQGIFFQTYHAEFDQNVAYQLNDLLGVFMLSKVYLVFRAMVSLTVFATPRASRLCEQNKFQHSFFYSVKCIQQEYPLKFVLVVFLVCLLLYSFGFRMTEGNLSLYNEMESNGFETQLNCFWFSFITMATIGYGDYIPKTTIGRMLAASLAIIGVLMNSLLVVALVEYLKMKGSETRAHTANTRLLKYAKLQDEAKTAIVKTIQIATMSSNNDIDPLAGRKLKASFLELKHYLEKAKTGQRKIKAILPMENIIEEMLRSFGLIKDNLRQICKHQRNIKRTLQMVEQGKMCQVARVRQSFLREVEVILDRYRQVIA